MKRKKEKALGGYDTQYKGKCSKCGKIGQKLDDQKPPKYKKEQQIIVTKKKN